MKTALTARWSHRLQAERGRFIQKARLPAKLPAVDKLPIEENTEARLPYMSSPFSHMAVHLAEACINSRPSPQNRLHLRYRLVLYLSTVLAAYGSRLSSKV